MVGYNDNCRNGVLFGDCCRKFLYEICNLQYTPKAIVLAYGMYHIQSGVVVCIVESVAMDINSRLSASMCFVCARKLVYVFVEWIAC